jgi:hypothetical protein
VVPARHNAPRASTSLPPSGPRKGLRAMVEEQLQLEFACGQRERASRGGNSPRRPRPLRRRSRGAPARRGRGRVEGKACVRWVDAHARGGGGISWRHANLCNPHTNHTHTQVVWQGAQGRKHTAHFAQATRAKESSRRELLACVRNSPRSQLRHSCWSDEGRWLWTNEGCAPHNSESSGADLTLSQKNEFF